MMLKSLYGFLAGTLRGRLILSVAAVHAVMMALFVADLTVRQRSLLLDRQIEEATALSQSLATSSAGWIAASDISGLQELVEAQRRYSGVSFAILVDEEGRVLADMDGTRRGIYMLDLPRDVEVTVLSRTSDLVDVAAPAIIGGRHVGWARVGIGQRAAGDRLEAITRNGVLYALAAILIGSVIAWFMGRRITERLQAVQETINAVRSGNRLARSQIVGADEAAVMAREFNSMLDALGEREAELSSSEERYRSLIHGVSVAIILHDGQGRILDSNPLARNLLGLSLDQLFGKALVDPDWHFLRENGSVMPVEEYPVSKVLSTRQPLRDYVTGIHRPDREEVTWALVNVEPEYDAAGEIMQVIVSFVDISERKRAVDALRDSERRLAEAQRIAQIGSWELNLINDVLTWSDEIFRIFEIDPKKFGATYEAFLDAIHPDDRESVNVAYTSSLQTRTPYVIEHRLLFTDGRIKYVQEQCETYYDGDKPVRSAGTVQDITERKRAEEEIQKLNDELEQRVADRTSALEVANRELEAFAYSVSHDLRTPLRHIDGFVGLLRRKTATTLDEESQHYMSSISDAARRMGILIDDLLSFSRMGRNEITRTQVNPEPLVRDIIREFEPETKGRVIRWSIASLPVATGDRAMLRIVLVNLISNALKFTRPRAEAEIEIGFREEKDETVIFVRDNGVGFDMKYVDRLFGVFQRLHGVDEFEGTGIGLANVRRIIARHGGRTWAEGSVGGGAAFYFSLPRTTSEGVLNAN